MKANPSIIGITTKIPSISFNIDRIDEVIFNPEFHKKLFDEIALEIIEIKGNCIHLTYKKHEFNFETELILEKMEPDTLSPVVFDFYTIHNSHCDQLEGKIRIKKEGSQLKIGIFVYELAITKVYQNVLSDHQMKRIIRQLFEKIFENLTKMR